MSRENAEAIRTKQASALKARRARFRKMHESGCFLLPNPWDIGSAMRLGRLGFQALATSSAAAAWAIGRDDGEIAIDDALAHLELICGATDLPVNADFEAGFAADPEGVGVNVTRAIATGIAGLSIEDLVGGSLRDRKLAIECVAAARAAIDASGEDVVLVGRTEAYRAGQPDAKLAIDRLVAFAEAGADCLFAPGVTDMATIADMVRAVAPKPLNVIMWGSAMKPAELAGAGVRRISIGGTLASKAWAAFDTAAQEFRESLADRP